MLTALKLYKNADATASADGIVSIDIPADGSIECISWNVLGIDAAIASTILELSLSSASGFTTSDTRAALSQIAIANGAAGAAAMVNHHLHFNDTVKVEGGERIFIHLLNATAVVFDTLRISCFIYMKLSGSGAGRTRRL